MSADHQKSSGVRDTFLRTVAVVGLLAVLILGAWGIILLASYLPTVFYSDSNDDSNLSDNSGYIVAPEDNDVYVVPVQPSTPSKPVYTTPVYTSPVQTQPAATYTAAPVRAQLYGSSDLAVYINSVTPAAGNRMVMQFTVQNVGTNIAANGWAFNAQIPWNSSSYTYASPSQQALYPGDKIVYSLGFDRISNSNNYDNDYRYDSDDEERYEDCEDDDSRDNWDQNDWLDWYDEYVDDNDNNEDWDRGDWEDWYFDDYCDTRDARDYQDYNDSRDDDRYTSTNGRVTVIVDPQGRVYEINRSNNTASANVN